jgi:hypothetical protein
MVFGLHCRWEMAEVIHVFETPVLLNGIPYRAQVVGRPEGNIWEGWIEFVSSDGTDALRTRRETTQPDRQALVYWATGISGTYLEGALARTLTPPAVRVEERSVPYFDAPAPGPLVEIDAPVPEGAVLDPFSVGAKGEELLRRELSALRGWHLRNIIRAYELVDDDTDLDTLTEQELTEIIVAAVQPV